MKISIWKARYQTDWYRRPGPDADPKWRFKGSVVPGTYQVAHGGGWQVSSPRRRLKGRRCCGAYSISSESCAVSFEARAARLYRGRPFVELAQHELGEIVRIAPLAGWNIEAEAFEPLPGGRCVKDVTGRPGEARHDRRRRAL